MAPLRIEALSPADNAALAELLVEAVEAGASVSFMHPLPRESAEAFWRTSLEAAARGERVVLGAWDGDVLAGTVTLHLDCAQNQPHRGAVAKMITRLSHRGRGVATALMRSLETVAAERGRTLLVLDTADDGGASGLYKSLGFTFAGVIPDYAFKPKGGLSGAKFYWKRLEPAAA